MMRSLLSLFSRKLLKLMRCVVKGASGKALRHPC